MEVLEADVQFLEHFIVNQLEKGPKQLKELQNCFNLEFGFVDIERFGANNLREFIQKCPDLFSITENLDDFTVAIAEHGLLGSDEINIKEYLIGSELCFNPTQELNSSSDDDKEKIQKSNGSIVPEIPHTDIQPEFFEEIKNTKDAPKTEFFHLRRPIAALLSVEHEDKEILKNIKALDQEDEDKYSDDDPHPFDNLDWSKVDPINVSVPSDFSDDDLVNDFDTVFDSLDRARNADLTNIKRKYDDEFSKIDNGDDFESVSSISDQNFNLDDDMLEYFRNYSEEEDNDKVSECSDKSKVLFSMDDPILYMSFPPHNRDPDVKLPPQQKLDVNFSEKIFLSEIHSPCHFWFQLGENKFWSMENKLNQYYRGIEEDDLKIAKQNMKVGLIVVIYEPGFESWYRARITKVRAKSVKVFLMDYGTSCSKKFHFVKYILNEFLEQPAKCYRGRFYGVQPLDDIKSFSIHEREAFIKIVANKMLLANCEYYNVKQDCYELNLKFQDGELRDDICKDDGNPKIAKPIPEKTLKERASGEGIDPLYLILPSFKMLENSRYPSFDRLITLNNKKINFYELMQTNFFMATEDISPEIIHFVKTCKNFRFIQNVLTTPKKDEVDFKSGITEFSYHEYK